MSNPNWLDSKDTIKGHKLYVYHELTQITPIIDTDTDGCVIMSDYSEIMDIFNTQLMCDTCEMEGLDLYETHEISPEWQAY